MKIALLGDGKMGEVIEEIALNNGWLRNEQVAQTAKILSKNSYGQYLKNLMEI